MHEDVNIRLAKFLKKNHISDQHPQFLGPAPMPSPPPELPHIVPVTLPPLPLPLPRPHPINGMLTNQCYAYLKVISYQSCFNLSKGTR